MKRLSLPALLLALAVLAAPAGADAPRSQRAALESGSAILRFGGAAGRERLAAELRRLGLRARFLQALPMVAVEGTAASIRTAARIDGVVAAHSDRALQLELYQGTPLVFGGQQAALAAQGVDGRGVNVAVVDSGVDGLHADLADHTVANFEVVGDGGGAIVQGCPLPGSGCDTDENGHGTHVAGIAVGDGSASSGFHTGIAPGAGLVGYSVGAGPSILFAVTAYDHILAHPELGVRVVNSSFGVQGGGRFDSADPINQATKRLHDAGIVVVFSNGNSGANTTDDNPPGASNCAPSDAADQCKTNPYSVAPWVISAAAAHKDGASRPRAEQHLGFYSARGDPDPQTALSGETIDYSPTLTAPGSNVRSLRDPTATDSTAVALAGDTCALSPPPGGSSYEPSYTPLSGTSMAAPAVTGAVAVMQSAALAHLGRALTPSEVESLLTSSAVPMTGIDGYWEFECLGLATYGTSDAERGETGQPYADWQVGAGYLDVSGAVAAVRAMPRPPGSGPGGPGPAATGAQGSGGPPPCRDDQAPLARMRRSGASQRRGRVRLAGTAADAACGGAPGTVRRVSLAVARGIGGGRCRFVGSSGRLGSPRSCRRRRYLHAVGTSSWRLTLRRRPPAGSYMVWARATDAAGNTSRPLRLLRLRLR